MKLIGSGVASWAAQTKWPFALAVPRPLATMRRSPRSAILDRVFDSNIVMTLPVA